MTLLEPHNLPFLLALIALVLISFAQILGLGDLFDAGDVDIDVDLDIEAAGESEFDVDPEALTASGWVAGAFSLLGLGKVPFLIWLMVLLFVFAAIGVAGQQFMIALIGAPLSTALAAVLAGLAALPVNGVITRPLAKLLPQDETSAVPLDSLCAAMQRSRSAPPKRAARRVPKCSIFTGIPILSWLNRMIPRPL